mgnify:CR=1 FL=1
MRKPLTGEDRHRLLFIAGGQETELAPLLFLIHESPFYKTILDQLVERGIVGKSLLEFVRKDFGGDFIKAANSLELKARSIITKMQN